MKRIIVSLIALGILCGPRLSAQEDALSIVREVDRRQHVDTSRTRTRMRTYPDAANEKDYREFLITGYERGDDESYMEVLEPKAVKGLRILSIGDDNWLFFPSTGRVRKIAGSAKGESVQGVGGDFSYEDLSAGKFEEKYSFKLVKNGAESWTLEGTARKEGSVYSKVVIEVEKSNYQPVRIEFHTSKDGHLKTLILSEFKILGGRRTATRMVMTNHKKGSGTVVTTESATYGEPVPDKLLNPAQFHK